MTRLTQRAHRFLETVGEALLSGISQAGSMVLFLLQALRASLRAPRRVALTLAHAEFVGVGSLFIVLLTALFTGAVFALQSGDAFARVGMESLVGSSVMLAVSRELGPVLTSLMVTGRVGSAIATELGTMRVTEQIDAIEVMAIDPIQYLVAPRIIATALMVPILVVFFDVIAGVGAYIVAIGLLGIDEAAYFARIEWYLGPYDFMQGLLKSLIFGIVIATVGCYKGYHATGGARGVGVATTQAVVIGSVAIFVLDYVLTSFLLLGAPD